MKTLAYSTTLTTLDCGECAIPFAMPTNVYNAALKDGRWFYCPNGHRIHFYKTENAKLADELAQAKTSLIRERNRLQDERAAHEHTEHRRRSEKAAKTKLKKRIAGGACPCCNRTFVDLAKHMAGQHPDFAPPVSEEST